jgi:multimeric flavodoxin WrbA
MQGNTGRLLEEVLAGIKAFGAETEVLSLKDPNGLEYLFEPLRNKITR